VTGTRVAICVATFKRPQGLDRLLESLADVDVPDELVTMRVIVLDNDKDRSAQSVVERYADRLSDLAYVVEPEKGVSRARNRLVSIALDRPDPPDCVVFVDDDEWVDPPWLRTFLACSCRSQCVLAGPVLPVYGPSVPGWVQQGNFFERARNSNGSRALFVGAGNLLIPRHVLAAFPDGKPFGEVFDRPGGEDTLFSVLVRRYGYEIRWCDDAVAHEEVTERASAIWLVRRAFNGGFDYTRVVRLTRSSWRDLVWRAGSGVGHFALGILSLPPALFRGRAAVLRTLRRCAEGAGNLAGLFYPMPSTGTTAKRSSP
jgi:succinoglycan biosynthesis protein ExoM